MEASSGVDKSVKFKSVLNTYTYIEKTKQKQSRDQTKPRHSVDLEMMFFGGLDECNIDEDDGEYDDSSDESDNRSSVTSSDNAADDEKSVGDTSGSEGAASAQRDGTSTGGSRSSTGRERGEIPAGAATTDLMSRFYARLQELKETKEEDERGSTTVDVATRNKDRMRIKTALRRLLTNRLFPEKALEEKKGKLSVPQFSRETTNFDDGSSGAFTSGTITPQTLGSRSKTFSLYSRQEATRGNDVTRQGTRGKVVFIGESSHLTDSSTDPPPVNGQLRKSGQTVEDEEDEKAVERVAYYRRHPLGPVRGFSRLYQPARPPTRSKTSLSQSALQREGLKKDRAFLQRMSGAQGVREDTRWSLPGERGPENYTSQEVKPSTSMWRRENPPSSAWSYNMPQYKLPDNDDEQTLAGDASGKGHLWYKDIDDLDLRKLLEELYRDKKYMDRIINTKEANDKTEEEVCLRLEDGREYLLDRARFWKEKGPLPPRPPTTDLGMRLQRERTLQSRMTMESDRQSRMTNNQERQSRLDGAESRQKTNVSPQGLMGQESQQGKDTPRQDNKSPREKEDPVNHTDQEAHPEPQMVQAESKPPPKPYPDNQESSYKGQVLNLDDGTSYQKDVEYPQTSQTSGNSPLSQELKATNHHEEQYPKRPTFTNSEDGNSPGDSQQSLSNHQEPEIQDRRVEQEEQAQPQHEHQAQQQDQQLAHQEKDAGLYQEHNHHQQQRPSQQNQTQKEGQQQQQQQQQDQQDQQRTGGFQNEQSPSPGSGQHNHVVPNGSISPLNK
ncbi:hypothetical protein PoB_001463400 [Plakobranchus ocellatus]|uniref:Uncharacterized protein n=1 Tax=Plakobranchus ocellatus TaxID=259542 RepID=A0AAV3Z149_9GAST|nr:hypothetical protein PoB_001463400 [Plakobranchus ocellatus]